MKCKVLSATPIVTFSILFSSVATSGKACREHNLMRVIAFAILILVGTAGASPFAYIANYNSTNISVIDTATDKVTATLTAGSNTYEVAVTPDGTKAYVTIIVMTKAVFL